MRSRHGVDPLPTQPAVPVPGRGPIQAKRELAVGRGELIGPADAAPAASHDAPAAPGRALPGALRGKMEAAFGADFSGVQVHEDGQAAAHGAVAFARGEHLHFQPGRFDAESTAGQELIGHELAHVVQQRAGRVATPMGKGGINSDPALEAEADQLGARAARGEATGAATAATRAGDEGPAQLQSELGRNRVAELQPGAHGGWRWVSGGNTHITIFMNADSCNRLRVELDARRIRRLHNNRLDMNTVPNNFHFYYDEFHVTINGVHFYYDDQGTPLADNLSGFGHSPAFDVAGWAAANREAAQFLGIDRYTINQRINGLGGHLPASLAEEQALANPQPVNANPVNANNAVPPRANPRANALFQNAFRAQQLRNAANRGATGTRKTPATGQATDEKQPTKRKLSDSAPSREQSDANDKAEDEQLLDEHSTASTKHFKKDPDPDPDGSGNGTGTGTGAASTNDQIMVQ